MAAKVPPNPINGLFPKATVKSSTTKGGKTTTTSTTGDTTTVSTYDAGFNPKTEGWYFTVGIIGAVMLSNVPVVGPLLLGILGVALIVQISLLLQGK